MSMSPAYIPEPYATIIKRLGNAYDTGFFVNQAFLCLAVILREAAEQNGHPAQIKLMIEDHEILHSAYIVIEVDDHAFDLDIKGRNAGVRALKDLEDIAEVHNCRDRRENETYPEYMESLARQAAADGHLEPIAGGKDHSKSYSFIRNLAFDYA